MQSQGAMDFLGVLNSLTPTNGQRQGDEEIYILDVSGAIVGNPDTIHDEVTTQVFFRRYNREMQPKLPDIIIWLKNKIHVNYGIVHQHEQ